MTVAPNSSTEINDTFEDLSATAQPENISPVIKPQEVKKQTPVKDIPPQKTILDAAKYIVLNEAKEVGPACNRFIIRILEILGLGKGDYMANYFDDWVKKYYPASVVEHFKYDQKGVERQRLKDYIFSFPEKTGLIFQWKIKGPNGHMAVVERVGDKLVIFQASLNTHNPQSSSVPLEFLLNRGLVDLYVYSEFRK